MAKNVLVAFKCQNKLKFQNEYFIIRLKDDVIFFLILKSTNALNISHLMTENRI